MTCILSGQLFGISNFHSNDRKTKFSSNLNFGALADTERMLIRGLVSHDILGLVSIGVVGVLHADV